MWKCTSFVKYVHPSNGFSSTTRFTSPNFKTVSIVTKQSSNFLLPHATFKRTYTNDQQQQTNKPNNNRKLWITAAATVCGGYFIYNILDNKSDKPKTANQWQMQVLQLLPLRFTSYLWGLLTHIELPTFMRSPVYRLYSWTFGALPEEASEPLESYKSVAEFFARRLKSDMRIIEPGPMVSPVDGTVLHFGEINGDTIEQVKGVNYSLEALLGKTSLIEDLERDRNLPKGAKKLYHCIIYLSPGDYHGIHSPVNWSVGQRRYFPGYLFPVAPQVVRYIEGLFAINERVVLTGQWEHGFFSLTPVGATNVGSIVVNFDKELITNQINKPKEKCIEKSFSPEIVAKKGDEIAFFHMGSTVVLIFQCPEFEFQIQGGQKVKLGQQLGQVVETLSKNPPKLNEMVPTKVKVDNVPVSES